ncbi:hypothetical protein [Butyrivibrio sp. VCB2006]|uniref:hypothetical protein n=1 Tax=Butyrivibrio sp. VCB2006 TaxID=1280679 RepID=UPI0004123E09|nr:hypothetical protein [Butyrivibrio sp. VCB2006]
MSSNASIDFLEMLKGGTGNSKKAVPPIAKNGNLIAVIDTETNWRDEVMSIGVAIADSVTFKCKNTRYYILDPAYRVGGMYSNVLNYQEKHLGSATVNNSKPQCLSRKKAIDEISTFLRGNGISKIFAYNGKFDLSHLRELDSFEWYDIMRLAAYKQFNKAIKDTMPCCKTGRLKTSYGVEPITRMLTGNVGYCEVHNAVYDAVDELAIMEYLGQPLSAYDCAKIN